MPVGEGDAPLVAVEGLEAAGDGEDIDRLVEQPVDVLDVRAAQEVVFAGQEEVEFGHVHRVAVGLDQRAVVVAVHRDLGVAVGVAAVDAVRLPFGLDLVAADSLHVLRLVFVDHVGRYLVNDAAHQLRRHDLRHEARQLRGVDVGVLEQEPRVIAVVRRPGGPDIAGAVRRQAPAGVLPEARHRDVLRPQPAVSLERRAPDLPGGPVGRGLAEDVGLARGPVPEVEPDASIGVREQHGEVVVTLEFLGQGLVDVGGRRAPLPAVMDRDVHRAPLVEPRALPVEHPAGVLPPVHSALVPRRPDAVLPVDGEADVRLVLGGRGDRHLLAPLAAGVAADHHVVVAGVVCVPADVDAALRVGDDHRLPVVRRRRRDLLGLGPAFSVVAAGEDVGGAVAEALPDHPEIALGVRRQVVEHVRLRRFGQPFRRRPAIAVQNAGVEIPVAVDLSRVDDPGAAIPVAAHLHEKVIAGLLRQGLDLAPALPVEAAGQHLVRVVPVAEPGGPDLVAVTAEDRREVVLVIVGGHPLHPGHALDRHVAAQEPQPTADRDIGEPDLELAARRGEHEPRAAVAPHVDDQSGRPDVLDRTDGLRIVDRAGPEVRPLVAGHLPGGALDLVAGPRPPVAETHQFAARHFERAVPVAGGRVVHAEADEERDDVVAGERAGLLGRGGRRRERERQGGRRCGSRSEGDLVVWHCRLA